MHLQQERAMHPVAATVDVREVAPRDRHPLIFSTFSGLGNGQAFELVNDHDPKPLRYQFEAEMPGQFAWEYLLSGPDVWRVRVTKVRKTHSDGQCCGSCGGS
jgi:uncharacterized protein (DUF2249 family)